MSADQFIEQNKQYILNVDGCLTGDANITLMGKNGSGKTTTGLQIALELIEKSGIPFIFIDPKGEFVDGNQPKGKLAELGTQVGAIEVGTSPIPLDFLPLSLPDY